MEKELHAAPVARSRTLSAFPCSGSSPGRRSCPRHEDRVSAVSDRVTALLSQYLRSNAAQVLASPLVAGRRARARAGPRARAIVDLCRRAVRRRGVFGARSTLRPDVTVTNVRGRQRLRGPAASRMVVAAGVHPHRRPQRVPGSSARPTSRAPVDVSAASGTPTRKPRDPHGRAESPSGTSKRFQANGGDVTTTFQRPPTRGGNMR